MKTVSLIFLFAFLLALPGKGQFIDIKSPDISTFFVNAAMVSEDSLFFFPTSDSLLPNGKKRIPAYSKHKVVLNGQRQAIFDTTTIVKDSFEVITHHILTAKNSGRIEVGSIRHNDSNAFDSRIWIKTDQFPHYDSIQILPKIDTGNFFFRIFKAIPIKNQIYIFGDVAFNYFPFSKAFALKYNLKTQQFTVNYYYCFDFFCMIHDAIYLEDQAKFIVTSAALIRDTLAQHGFGGGIAKIDTNLIMDTASSHIMEVNYAPPGYVPLKQYIHSTTLFNVNAEEFLIAGGITNPHSINPPPNIKNNKYDEDIAVSLRSKDSLMETAVPNIYGKIDTGESHPADIFIFEKIDSNLFVAASNMNLNNFFPENYNTSLALFGMNEAGKKHWELYLPFKDYCFTTKAVPDSKGGLWVVAVCSETDPNPNINFKSYVKVAYLDSLAFWPRKGGTVVGLEKPISSVEKSFSIFPNPAKYQLNIKQFGLLERLHYKIYDLSGRLLQTAIEKTHHSRLNIENLVNGLYLLRIERANGELIKTEKFVVER